MTGITRDIYMRVVLPLKSVDEFNISPLLYLSAVIILKNHKIASIDHSTILKISEQYVRKLLKLNLLFSGLYEHYLLVSHCDYN